MNDHQQEDSLGASQADSSERPFRTVLPHEPLPRDEGPGYLHIQGSFQPKIVRENATECSDARPDANNNVTTTAVPSESSVWTRDSLRNALSAYFMEQSKDSGHETSNRIAVAPTNVLVLDQSPPFTKVRLEYASTSLAFQAMTELKRRDIAPSHLLSSYQLHGNDAASHDSGHVMSFSSRPLQVILITQQPLATPGWSRSNPPKFRRLLSRTLSESESVLQKERQETRFVWMSNLFARPNDNEDPELDSLLQDRHYVAAAIRTVLDKFDSTGKGVEVFLSNNKLPGKHRYPAASSCHIGMRTPADAQALLHGLQEATVAWKFNMTHDTTIEIPSGALFLDYAAITQRSAIRDLAKNQGMELPKNVSTRPECTLATAHVQVPGLIVVHDFITEAQEAALMAVITGPQAPWAPQQSNSSGTGMVKRRVQHYGYVFDYKTANVLRDRTASGADCPPMPAMIHSSNQSNGDQGDHMQEQSLESYLDECVHAGEGWGLLAGITEQVRRFDFGKDQPDDNRLLFPNVNQITINQYKPGEGIGSHVDTPSAFGDGLFSLSLNSDIVMEFRKVNATSEEDKKKLVHLPRRSIVLMSRPARYEWEHMIASRSTDCHDGQVFPRGLRISLTFRTALDEAGLPMPLVQSNSYPPTWGDDQRVSTSSWRTPACEREHVHAVYDAIALQWHHTRGRRGVLWPGATRFLQDLEPGSIVADVGCGDGKYFPAIWQAGSYVIGTDISIPLLKTAFLADQKESVTPESRRVSGDRRHLRERPAVCAADCMSVPLQSKKFDAAICIAVLHHLSTKSRRRRCIEELIRIVKPGGLINIQAWALTQEDNSRRTFAASDVFVPFNAQPKYLKAVAAADSSTVADLHMSHKSTAQVYSEALNADFDERKGLVVFQRYCHLYKEGELEELLINMPNVEVVDAGFEAGNYYVIVRVLN